MSLADWQQFNTNMTVSIETITPILNSGSLKMAQSAVNFRLNMLPSVASLRPHAFTKGALRTLIKPVSFTGLVRIGVTCMQSGRDVHNVGACYFAHLSNSSIVLGKGDLHVFTTLATVPFTLTSGVVTALELQWLTLIDEISGVDLTVKTGVATDFSDLAEVIHMVDTSTPLSVTQGESLGVDDGSGGSLLTVLYDQTTLLQIL